jgi:hypothetical protein
MKCPVHEEELRLEYTENAEEGLTGICLKCPKRYRCCPSTYYMEPCDLLRGHEGKHVSVKGNMWEIAR